MGVRNEAQVGGNPSLRESSHCVCLNAISTVAISTVENFKMKEVHRF